MCFTFLHEILQMDYFKLWHFLVPHVLFLTHPKQTEIPQSIATKLRTSGWDDYVNHVAGGHWFLFLISTFHKWEVSFSFDFSLQSLISNHKFGCFVL